jgi:hypothetical protein
LQENPYEDWKKVFNKYILVSPENGWCRYEKILIIREMNDWWPNVATMAVLENF